MSVGDRTGQMFIVNNANHMPQFFFIINNSSKICIENCQLIKPLTIADLADNTQAVSQNALSYM